MAIKIPSLNPLQEPNSLKIPVGNLDSVKNIIDISESIQNYRIPSQPIIALNNKPQSNFYNVLEEAKAAQNVPISEVKHKRNFLLTITGK
jgi:hypothetical protein